MITFLISKKKYALMLNWISFFMCMGEVGFPKDGRVGFSIVFPLLVLFSLIAAQVVFSKAQGA